MKLSDCTKLELEWDTKPEVCRKIMAKIKKTKTKPSRARVLYHELPDGRIQIDGLEGFLTVADIAKKHGRPIVIEYVSNHPHMWIDITGRTIELHHNEKIEYFSTSYNSRLSPEDFANVIALMKQCGARLSKIIKEDRESLTEKLPEPKVIEI